MPMPMPRRLREYYSQYGKQPVLDAIAERYNTSALTPAQR
jgi:hypothetical protein